MILRYESINILTGLTNQVFGHRISNETTLKDIQDEVFDNIPLLLDKYGVEIKYDDEHLLELANNNVADGVKDEKDILEEESEIQSAVHIKCENDIAKDGIVKSGYKGNCKVDSAVEMDDVVMKDTDVYSPEAFDTHEEKRLNIVYFIKLLRFIPQKLLYCLDFLPSLYVIFL